jgi:hypothetical protein
LRRIWTILQFFPLAGFLYYARIHGYSEGAWENAFIIGGALAVLETAVLALKRIHLNRLILGANLFLILGGLGFLLELQPILNLYGKYTQAVLFFSMLLVGLATTLFTPSGYIGTTKCSKAWIRKNSLYLLAATLLATLISLYFRGSVLKAGLAPFLIIYFTRHYLIRKQTKA